jgi:hypothetical protein
MNYDSFEQWKKLVSMICRKEDIIHLRLFLSSNFFAAVFFNLSEFFETVVSDPHWSQCESEYGSRLSHTGSNNFAFPEPDPSFAIRLQVKIYIT